MSPKTVSRWAKEGKLPFLKTLGGHRRYPDAEIRELATELREEATADPAPARHEGRPARSGIGHTTRQAGAVRHWGDWVGVMGARRDEEWAPP